MKKHIAIIGGGISGLAVLHYLVQKYIQQPDVTIALYEKNNFVGGTIRSIDDDHGLIETGPNGFLNNNPYTLDFINELELTPHLIEAASQSSVRFIARANTLHEVPTSPKKFLSTKLLNVFQKFRLLGDFVIPKTSDSVISVYTFFRRRFGKRVADIFVDPMVSGIYAGDAKQICMRAAFPKIYDLEQMHGSMIRGMMKQKGKTNLGMLMSFKGGMQQLIDALYNRYKAHIFTNTQVLGVNKRDDSFSLQLETQTIDAQEVFLCAPAYHAATLVERWDQQFAAYLKEIHYAPVAVVGLTYLADAATLSNGFGYLIPSSEDNPVLGVLFESNIFKRSSNSILLRVMMGGVHHPKCLEQSDGHLIQVALLELRATLKITSEQYKAMVIRWPRAIPQYDRHYLAAKEKIETHITRYPQFHLAANYLNGVSVNDCIENAYKAVNK